ncbi:MAG: helix-turn-helix transcriptional regulator [Polyangiales bacterium]
MPRADPARAAHLLGGVRRIIGAAVGGYVTDCDFHPTGRGIPAAAALDGWDATTLPALDVLMQQGSQFSPGIAAMMRACPSTPGATISATRDEILDARAWYGSPYVDAFLLPTHLDDVILSCTRGATPTLVDGLGFYRERGDRPFDASDRALVHLFQLECPRLLAPPSAHIDDVLRDALPPRQQQTLGLLLEGHSDKEIADSLNISPHTVNQYTKALYRRLGVRSRAALIVRYRRTTLPDSRE